MGSQKDGGAGASTLNPILRHAAEQQREAERAIEELAVRLIGIDTPEVYPEVECFGPEAEALLADLAPVGTLLRVEYDLDPRDPYDRELLYLYTADGTFVNLELVARGAAEAVLFEPNDRYWDELRAAERAAQDARRGLWAQC